MKLVDYWGIGRKVRTLRSSRKAYGWADVASRTGMGQDNLRLAMHFAGYFTRAEAQELDEAGVSWRKAVELTRVKNEGKRRRLFVDLSQRNLSKQDLAARVERATGVRSMPRIPETPRGFLSRLAEEIRRIESVADVAHQLLTEQHAVDGSPHRSVWRTRAMQRNAEVICDDIGQAIPRLRRLQIALRKVITAASL